MWVLISVPLLGQPLKETTVNGKQIDGPKDHQNSPTDQKGVLCDKWFTIFQVDYTAVRGGQFVYVCHRDRLNLVRSAVEKKLASLSDSFPLDEWA
jgi:hypothetical protein